MAIPAYPSDVLNAAADDRYPAASSATLESMRAEPRRSAGGVRGMKLRTWGLALRRIEDFAAEAGGEAALFDRLCEFVTGGGYITDLCGKYAVDREVLLAWIRKDSERSRRWSQAEADRKDGQREEVLALWSDVMAAAPTMAPEWKDVLKASEMMARHAGVLRDGAGNAPPPVPSALVDIDDYTLQRAIELRRLREASAGAEDAVVVAPQLEPVALTERPTTPPHESQLV